MSSACRRLIRLPSLVAGIAGVWMAYRLGKALGGPTAARAAGVLSALLPGWAAYSQEARPYSIGLFLILALYVHITEERDRPVAHLLTAGLCGMWQYTVAGMALVVLFMACLRRPDRWRGPFGVCALSAALTAGWMLPGQWPRAADLAARMDAAMGVEAFALGLPSLTGYTLVGVGGPASMLLGGGALCAVVALRRSTPHDTSLVWAPLGVFACCAAAGWHPFGAVRPCLPLTVPIMVLFLGASVRLRRPLQACLSLLLVGVTCWRSPGVAVEDLAPIAEHIGQTRLPVSSHSSSVRALSLYAPALELRSVIPWDCTPQDLPEGPGWLIVSGRPACLEEVAPVAHPWVPYMTTEGVRLFKTPLPVRHAAPLQPRQRPRRGQGGL